MSTAEKPRPKTAKHLSDPELYNPLSRLRSTIRLYVLLEAAVSVLLFVTAWFALGLLFDFGFFKVTGLDWAAEAHWFFRVFLMIVAVTILSAFIEGPISAVIFGVAALFLGTLEFLALVVIAVVGGPDVWAWVEDAPFWFRLLTLGTVVFPLVLVVGFRLARRLTKELSYKTLALLLERKFPKLLGDRLITAVEMGNVNKMGKYGYSKEMLLATIAEARERVAKVPLGQVFNWGRLRLMAFVSAVLLGSTVLFAFNSYALAIDPNLLGGVWTPVVFAMVASLLNVALLVYAFGTRWFGLISAVAVLVLGCAFGFTSVNMFSRAVWFALLVLGVGLVFALNVVVPIAAVVRTLVVRRLKVLHAGLQICLLLTPYVLFAGYALASGTVSPYRFGWKFAHVSSIFLERNVALMGTPWPRRAHVELVGFPENEATVSRDIATVPVTARLYKWVIADRGVREGWRPMLWSDVNKDLVGRDVPEFDAAALRRADDPAGSVPDTAGSWTVDALERRVFVADDAPDASLTAEALGYRNDLRQKLGPTFGELQEVFKALNAKADQPSMGRTLRKLDLTQTVYKSDENGNLVASQEPLKLEFFFRGLKFKGRGDLTPKQNNEYSGDVSGLKEDVNFYVQADDFRTPLRRIRLIPPPTLKRLYRVQEEPAYLHHAPPQGLNFDDLRGKRQLMAEKNLSLTGERSVFVVPAGTQLTIHADAYTDDDGNLSDNDGVVSAYAVPVTGKFPGAVFGADGKPTQTQVPVRVTADGKGWSIAFKNLWDDLGTAGQLAVAVLKGAYPEKDARANVDFRLTLPVEFKVTWTNKYNVSTTRAVLIQVTQDQPPVVEVGVDVIRKSGNVYLVTPLARIPFNPDSFVKDDHGLSKVEYAFSYYAEDSDVVRSVRTKYALRSLLDLPATGPQHLQSVLLPRLQADNFRMLDKSDDRLSASVFVSEFVNQSGQLRRETPERLRQLLLAPSGDDTNPDAVRRIDLKNPDRDYFDLKELNDQKIIKILAAPGEVQPTFRMDLFVQATDNNADNEGGPRVTRTAEPIRLKIVSEGDLLLEISKEELQLGERLDDALAQLAVAKRAYDFVRTSNGYKAETQEIVDTVKVRSQAALQAVDKARDIVQTVLREFRRIARECQVNRVIDVTTKNYLGYCTRIEAILNEDPQASVAFPKTQNLMNIVHKDLAGEPGRWAPLAAVGDAESSLYVLERELISIRKLIGESQSKEQLIKTIKKIRDDQLLVQKSITVLYEKWLEKVSSKEPQIGEVGAIALTKGESKKVQHTIEWRQYKEDDLVVKVTASDPSLVVPAEMTLNFEKHQFRFDYEVKAGAKEGTFKITLKPAVGAPVEVTVVVK